MQPPDHTPSSNDPFERRLIERLHRLAEGQKAPDVLRNRILAGIAAENASAARTWRVRWDLIAAAFGGSLVTAAAALAIWFSNPVTSTSPTEAWFDVALAHTTGGGVFETTEPSVLGTWLADQMNYQMEVPDIPEAQLKGGRLAYMAGVRGAAVEYDFNGVDLTYMIVPTGASIGRITALPDSMWTWSSRGYQIVMWRQGGTTRALVAPLPTDELYGIADHCRRTMI